MVTLGYGGLSDNRQGDVLPEGLPLPMICLDNGSAKQGDILPEGLQAAQPGTIVDNIIEKNKTKILYEEGFDT